MSSAWLCATLARPWTWQDRGRDYARARVDCYGLVLHVSERHFGVRLPDPLYESALDLESTSAVIEASRGRFQRLEIAAARPGDVVLLRMAGLWHAALYTGGGFALQMTRSGASHRPLGRARIEGFYGVRA